MCLNTRSSITASLMRLLRSRSLSVWDLFFSLIGESGSLLLNIPNIILSVIIVYLVCKLDDRLISQFESSCCSVVVC